MYSTESNLHDLATVVFSVIVWWNLQLFISLSGNTFLFYDDIYILLTTMNLKGMFNEKLENEFPFLKKVDDED